MKLGIFFEKEYDELRPKITDFLLTINEFILRGHEVHYMVTRDIGEDLENVITSVLSTDVPRDSPENRLVGVERNVNLFDLDSFLLRDTRIGEGETIDMLTELAECKYFLNHPTKFIRVRDKTHHLELFDGFPVAATQVVSRTDFRNEYEKDLMRFLEFNKFPLVVKPHRGFAGDSVEKVEDLNELKFYVEQTLKTSEKVLVQEYLPECVDQEKRLVYLGGDLIVSYRRVPLKGWKLVCGKQGQIPYEATFEENEMGKEIVQRSGLNLAAVDMIGDKFSEINASPGFEYDANSTYENQSMKIHRNLVDYIEQGVLTQI